MSLKATFSKPREPTFLNLNILEDDWSTKLYSFEPHILEQYDWSSKLYLFEQQRNLQQKQQLTTSFFKVRGDRNRNLNGGGKICNMTGVYEVNKNEEINKITN